MEAAARALEAQRRRRGALRPVQLLVVNDLAGMSQMTALGNKEFLMAPNKVMNERWKGLMKQPMRASARELGFGVAQLRAFVLCQSQHTRLNPQKKGA